MNKLDLITSLKEELTRLFPLKRDDEMRLDEKFRLEFNFNSNNLEGNTLSYQDTKILLLKDIVPKSEIFTMRELEEMKAHDAAYYMINEWAKDKERELNAVDIKELNKLILVKDFWKDAITADGAPTRKLIKVGNYKDSPNSVQLSNGEIFEYADPIDVPAKMNDLFNWYDDHKDKLHPAALAALFHHKFILIHPFDDGNGRISRLLVNYILIRNGYPPIVIKSNDKKTYLNALRSADAGDIETFINFIIDQIQWSLETSLKAAKGENIDEVGDFEKKLAKFKKEKIQGFSSDGKLNEEKLNKLITSDFQDFYLRLENLCLNFDVFYNERSNAVDFFDLNNIFSFDIASFIEVKDSYFDLKFGKEVNIPSRLILVSFFSNPIINEIPENIKSLIIQFNFYFNRFELKIEEMKSYYFTYDNPRLDDKVDEIIEIIGNDLFQKMNTKNKSL